jgi:6-pyruvoyltetrahydropterin/6-carboxytetrahydropterin synthase
MPEVTVTRRMHFNAAHRVHNPQLSDEENERLFGRCNNPNWHGHNYILDVSVAGPVDDRTGYVLDLAALKRIVQEAVIERVDHRNFNLDVDFMRNVIPTAENIVVIATEGKIAALCGRPLRVDTGDSAIDEMLSGYIRVVTAYSREIVYRIAS